MIPSPIRPSLAGNYLLSTDLSVGLRFLFDGGVRALSDRCPVAISPINLANATGLRGRLRRFIAMFPISHHVP